MLYPSPTGERQICRSRYATMFLCDNMVDFMREESHARRKQTILATLPGSLHHQTAEFC